MTRRWVTAAPEAESPLGAAERAADGLTPTRKAALAMPSPKVRRASLHPRDVPKRTVPVG